MTFRVKKIDGIDYWGEIWKQKGLLDTNNILILNGYEGSGVDPIMISDFIFDSLGIKSDDSILEVGCGAGMLGQHMSEKCNYYGVDKSETLINKYKQIFGKKSKVLVSEGNNLPFKNQSFSAAFSFGVFHYFPSFEYVRQAIDEMFRVSKKAIFIGDLPYKSHDETHMLFKKQMFNNGIFSNGMYRKNVDSRFNVLLIK